MALSTSCVWALLHIILWTGEECFKREGVFNDHNSVRVCSKITTAWGCVQRSQQSKGVFDDHNSVRVCSTITTAWGCVQRSQPREGVFNDHSRVRVCSTITTAWGRVQRSHQREGVFNDHNSHLWARDNPSWCPRTWIPSPLQCQRLGWYYQGHCHGPLSATWQADCSTTLRFSLIFFYRGCWKMCL
jgi:hypothetical protein